VRILFDANVLLSFVTGRDASQHRRATELFRAARERQAILLLHQQVAAETALVLLRLHGRPASEVREMLSDLVRSPGVETVDALDWSALLGLWPATFPHFGDACLAAAVSPARADAIATFDRAFARRLRALGIAVHGESAP